MSVSGSGLSAGGSGGSADLDMILSGGPEFLARLRLHQSRQEAAATLKKEAEALLAEAKEMMARADETQMQADAQLAENIAAKEALDQAISDAKAARANLDARMAPLLAFLKE
jgi:hypothetical protein